MGKVFIKILRVGRIYLRVASIHIAFCEVIYNISGFPAIMFINIKFIVIVPYTGVSNRFFISLYLCYLKNIFIVKHDVRKHSMKMCQNEIHGVFIVKTKGFLIVIFNFI